MPPDECGARGAGGEDSVTATERAYHYVESAMMARTNAHTARRMAREWPRDASAYEADARRAFDRAYAYLRTARSLRKN